MKNTKKNDWFVLSFPSLEEYIDQLDEKGITNIKDELTYNANFLCVKDYETLEQNMRYDKELMDIYLKSNGYISFANQKAVAFERQFRESGTHFDYARYLDGRTCVYKRKPVYVSGSGKSKIVSVIVNLSENYLATKKQMMYKTMAVIEIVKALQSQGMNVELHVLLPSYKFFKTGKSFLVHICLKRGDAPLIVPEVVAACSPYFMRCYFVSAFRNRFHLKTKTEIEGKVLRSNNGSAIRFDDGTITPSLRDKIFSFCGIERDAIVIETKSITTSYELKTFRKEHGIQIRK